MLSRSGHAEKLYDALFDWQPPLSLWECAENLKIALGDDLLASRNVGRIEIKKVLEGWVTGKSLTMAYHGEPCLARVAPTAAMDGQIYREHRVQSVEVTQALYPGRKRNIFGAPYGGFPPPAPIASYEREAFERYRDQFIRQAFLQVEMRIEHKYQLYKELDYLLVYVDLFDATHPRFSYFALQEFYDDGHDDDLQHRLKQRFAQHWGDKIAHLFLLDDKPTGFVRRFASLPAYKTPVFEAQPYEPLQAL
jgi:hypothetical protein